jgi:hypothetical protein
MMEFSRNHDGTRTIVNMEPAQGAIAKVDPRCNAVLIHHIVGADGLLRRIVTIECKDEAQLPALKKEASRIYDLMNLDSGPASWTAK